MLKPVGSHDTEPDTRRAVIYTRISDDRDGEALGVQRQEEACREEASRLGYRVVAVECDNSVSAFKSKNRPGFDRTLDHVKAGRADTVIVWHLDRLARRIKDLQVVLDLCTGRKRACPNLIIHPVKGGEIRGDDATAHLTAQILTLVANFESAHKAERVRARALQRARAGVLGPGIYGYADDGDREPVEPAATAVRESFAAFLQTKSVAAAHRALKAADPKGAHAGESGMRKVLRRHAYAGLVTYKGVEQPDCTPQWKPLISVEDFRVAQAILDRPSRKHGTHDRGARRALLTGLVNCEVCGVRMKQITVTGGPNVGRYRSVSCPDHHIARKAEPIEAWIVALVMTRLGLADAQATVLPREPAAGAESLVKRWNELTEKRSRLSDLWMSDAMPDHDYDRLSRALGDDLRVLEAQLAALQVEPKSGTALPADPAFAMVGTSLAGLRSVIANLVDVTVLSTRRGRQAFDPSSVEVKWRREGVEADTSGRAAEHHPDDEWWAGIQEWLDNGLADAAEAFVNEHPPPPLSDAQRRALWVALTPAADEALEAEVD